MSFIHKKGDDPMDKLKPFQDDLPIPDVVRPVPGVPSAHFLAIAARAEQVKLHHDLPAPAHVWCYRLEHGEVVRKGTGATYLGPTVEVNKNEAVTVAWKNEIPDAHRLPFEVIKTNADAAHPVPQNEPGRANAIPESDDVARVRLRDLRATLVTHLHGACVQADSDGWTDNTVVSGQAAHYTYPNCQAAAMLWYHDHCMHVTRANVFAGLAAVWLVRDDEERALHLPAGAGEVPLVIQDRNLDLDAQGQFTGALLHKTEVNGGVGPAEFFGPYTLVNGKIWPRAAVAPQLYRFRVINASNARTYRLLLLDDKGEDRSGSAVWQIGCDQGLMPERLRLPDTGLTLAPAERADLLVDFSDSAGKSLYLWNTAEAPFGDRAEQEPDPAHVKDELTGLLADPFFSADAVNPDNAGFRRLFPQVLRFDVSAHAKGPSHTLPPLTLSKTACPTPDFHENTTVRVMALVEKPHDAPLPADATTMLVFYEFLRVADKPAPPGALVVTITYMHPGKKTTVTEPFWKAAEPFYDQINWFAHLGSTELWYIVNLSGDTHPIHVHLVHFQRPANGLEDREFLT